VSQPDTAWIIERLRTPRGRVSLQGMDTSGKGGVLRSAVGLFDPQGVRIKAFKTPIAERSNAATATPRRG